ncbi:uncharacterized protein LOC143548243 [Bidens hawaiensis]|uniref:uncharacterized protein LOC143548243 n=1 Tax=Bidens hawaiensis TaxID=980011 RepID=UPI00404B1FE7
MSSDSSLTPDFKPDIDDISNSDLEDEAIFSAVLEAARLVVQHYESSQPLKRRPHLQRDRVESVYAFFQQRADARGKPGYSTMQKCTAAIRQLAYGTASDAMKEYLQMFETVAREALHTFCECQYHQGDHDGPTVILEAATSFDLWIWHAFFGTPGANNDVAVINASPIFDRLTDGVSPDISFSTNDVNYEYGYYLVDGIYPEWATLVLSFTCPTDEKHQYFKKKHESARKDIKRAFSVLKKRWSIIRQPARFL